MKLYAQCQAAYGLALAMVMILNGILRAIDPYNTALTEDSSGFVDEIIILTERASPFRPLTASYIPLCLTIAWAATDDISRKVVMEKYLAEYQTDMANARWLEGAVWLKSQYRCWRRKSLTPFSENPSDRSGVDSDAISRDPRTATHAEGQCHVQ